MNVALWKKIDGFIRTGNISGAIQYLEQKLTSCEGERFKPITSEWFKNNPEEISGKINNFIVSCESRFDVKAVYLEMNGFDINPDRWYFDYFGYRTYQEDPGDLDWLAEWDSENWPETTLQGMEKTQEDYDWYSNHSGYKEENADISSEYATLLVMCKFVHLVEEAVETGNIKNKTPILATAHDLDIIARFMP